MQTTELLVIGAGPYGLCTAAHATDLGLDVAIVGECMAFWKHNMKPLRNRQPSDSMGEIGGRVLRDAA